MAYFRPIYLITDGRLRSLIRLLKQRVLITPEAPPKRPLWIARGSTVCLDRGSPAVFGDQSGGGREGELVIQPPGHSQPAIMNGRAVAAAAAARRVGGAICPLAALRSMRWRPAVRPGSRQK